MSLIKVNDSEFFYALKKVFTDETQLVLTICATAPHHTNSVHHCILQSALMSYNNSEEKGSLGRS